MQHELIAAARKSLASARTIERNVRLKRYNGRNAYSTEDALRRHEREADEAMALLPLHVASAIRDEHQLASRISEDKDENGRRPGSRPELQRRLRSARSQIKAAERSSREAAYRAGERV